MRRGKNQEVSDIYVSASDCCYFDKKPSFGSYLARSESISWVWAGIGCIDEQTPPTQHRVRGADSVTALTWGQRCHFWQNANRKIWARTALWGIQIWEHCCSIALWSISEQKTLLSEHVIHFHPAWEIFHWNKMFKSSVKRTNNWAFLLTFPAVMHKKSECGSFSELIQGKEFTFRNNCAVGPTACMSGTCCLAVASH